MELTAKQVKVKGSGVCVLPSPIIPVYTAKLTTKFTNFSFHTEICEKISNFMSSKNLYP